MNKPLTLKIVIPANTDDSFDFQSAMISHLIKGLGLETISEGKWMNQEARVTMEIVDADV